MLSGLEAVAPAPVAVSKLATELPLGRQEVDMRISTVVGLVVLLWAPPSSAQNLLSNADFGLDPGLPGNGWAAVGTGLLTHVTLGGYPAPPSIRVETSGGEGMALQQCVSIDPSERLDFSAYSSTHSSSGASSNAVQVSFFAGPSCGGAALGTVATTGLAFPDWAYRWAPWVAPPVGAGSARLELVAEANGSTMNISWDTAFLGPSEIVFMDDFENGDTSAWSGVVP